MLLRVILALLLVSWFSPGLGAQTYPLSPSDPCGSSQTCQQVLDRWNQASWNDLVDDDFNTGAQELAAVRWYTTEGTCTGPFCNEQLNDDQGTCPPLDATASRFCGVTDELSNVLLSHAMGSNQARYQKLHNFAELLRVPIINDLQCWKYYVDGDQVYNDHTQLCEINDSASDASIRILGAYAIACAKQQTGEWIDLGVDYCADYLQQGNAIWGRGTSHHGEIKLLANGQYFLANGYNNQEGAPINGDAFRPDYYELQFLMDFAKFVDDPALEQGVLDMLDDYRVSMGTNHIHRGKTGHFDATTSSYECDQLCDMPAPYMDANDTWRAVPALSGLLNVYPSDVPAGAKADVFDYWWNNYSGGHPSLYGPMDEKPFELYANAEDGLFVIKTDEEGMVESDGKEESYKTLGMWIPLAAAYDAAYAEAAIDFLVDVKYDSTNEQFFGAAYYGGYFSQFAQRAIGSVTGMISPAFWRGDLIFADGFESGDTSRWSVAVP